MRIVIFLSLFAVSSCYSVSFDAQLNDTWTNFKVLYNKSYSGTEEIRRRMIFEDTVVAINKHNLKADLGLLSYRRGLNKYSDLSHEEYLKSLTNLKPRNSPVNSNSSSWLLLTNVLVSDHVDWRDKGMVTNVKDQGMCGSCWAFSVTGSLEGQHKRKTGQLVSLSEQNLVDCVRENHGCEGGWMDQAFEYVIQQKGIDTEESYPYTGVPDSCFFNDLTVGATCSGFMDIPSGNETALKAAVSTVGPVSVAIDASSENFHSYKSGIYDSRDCRNDLMGLDHAVLVVGYGTDGGKDYWIVKNSWGTTWGDAGYIKMSRNKNNQCGIATKASYPLV